MDGETKSHLRTNFKPKENIGKDFTINSNYHEKSRRHFSIQPGEKKVEEVPKGRKHIKAPFVQDQINFITQGEEEKNKPKVFQTPRPNTKPEFHTKKFVPSRQILKNHNQSSISFDNYSETEAPVRTNRRSIYARIDPATLPAAGTKTGFYGIS